MEAKKLTQENIMKILEAIYSQAKNGVSTVLPPIEDTVDNYLHDYIDAPSAAKAFAKSQIIKCSVSGFITGFGGLITLPVSIPANIGSVLFVQMRMIQGIAFIGGYDINDDRIQTFIYACLAGISVNQALKKFGIAVGQKITAKTVSKIPGKICIQINKAVGFRFITKAGEKGLINLGKLTPIIGAPINAGFDFFETKVIADRAYKMFILGDLDASDESNDSNVNFTIEEI